MFSPSFKKAFALQFTLIFSQIASLIRMLHHLSFWVPSELLSAQTRINDIICVNDVILHLLKKIHFLE